MPGQKSMRTLIRLTLLLFFVSSRLQAQEPEMDRLIQNEFKMTFPSIYFKHQSSEYAAMPYTAAKNEIVPAFDLKIFFAGICC